MNIILGAGIAGLGAYCADNSSYIFEQAPKAGGLCANFVINGFLFDKAVHLSFTNGSFVRSYFDRVIPLVRSGIFVLIPRCPKTNYKW